MGGIRAIELPSGQIIWARITSDGPSDAAGGTLASVLDGGELLKSVSSIAETIHDSLVPLMPDSVGVEFGIELSIRAGRLIGVLADVGGSSSLKISLSWERSSSAAPALAAKDAVPPAPSD